MESMFVNKKKFTKLFTTESYGNGSVFEMSLSFNNQGILTTDPSE